MDKKLELIYEIEVHNVEKIRSLFDEGIDPNDSYKGKTLFTYMVQMYMRSPRFKDCIKAFLDYGLNYDDPILLSVLLDDKTKLKEQLTGNTSAVEKRYSYESAYTQMEEATLLHICAEYNHVQCAEVLLNQGLDVDTKAGVDEHGFGAQTAIFHTVNQNLHQSKEMMELLLDHKSDLDYTVKGFIWGKGFEWETFIPSVNPISYAMMGLLPQFHRNQEVIANVITKLLHFKYGIDYTPGNVPNKYLKNS